MKASLSFYHNLILCKEISKFKSHKIIGSYRVLNKFFKQIWKKNRLDEIWQGDLGIIKTQTTMSRQVIRKDRFNQIRMMTAQTLSTMFHQSGLHKTSTSRIL